MKKIVTILMTIVALAMVVFAAGCGANTTHDDHADHADENHELTAVEKTNSEPINVVSTIGMINDVVKNVGGEHVVAKGLMGPGVDPHLYKASAGDVATLSEADLIFYNGLHLEAKMGEVLEQMSGRVRVYPVSANLPRDKLLASEDYEDQYDPHVWFNVEFWSIATERIRDALKDVDPANADAYDANAEEYLVELAELHAYVHERVLEVPENARVLVTAHDAFRYFGDEYGFEVRGLQGISTEAEAGTGDVQEIVDFIVDREIKAIFVESSVPERNIKAVQEAAKAKGWDVTIGGELFSDAMGDEGTVEGTYLGMVYHNTDSIADALK